MGNHVIALGRQFGSGGRELGKRLAETLGYAYYDRELITAIAEKSDFNDSGGSTWFCIISRLFICSKGNNCSSYSS